MHTASLPFFYDVRQQEKSTCAFCRARSAAAAAAASSRSSSSAACCDLCRKARACSSAWLGSWHRACSLLPCSRSCTQQPACGVTRHNNSHPTDLTCAPRADRCTSACNMPAQSGVGSQDDRASRTPCTTCTGEAASSSCALSRQTSLSRRSWSRCSLESWKGAGLLHMSMSP